MKKTFGNVFSVFLTAVLVFTSVGCATTVIKKDSVASGGVYAGKTIILHDNDVHGALEGYAKVAGLKSFYEDMGATVLVVSAGDFSQGSPYVNRNGGYSAIRLMNEVGYDVVGLGNHEFDYGYENLMNNLKQGEFVSICSNIFRKGKTVLPSDVIIDVNGLKIGFFALVTPETSMMNPDLIKGLEFALSDNADKKYNLFSIAQKETDSLSGKADIVICLGHLGIYEKTAVAECSSYDVMDNVSGDFFMIDAHSHQAMTGKRNGNTLQNTGISFENIGVIVIDNASAKIIDSFLIDAETIEADKNILAFAHKMMKE